MTVNESQTPLWQEEGKKVGTALVVMLALLPLSAQVEALGAAVMQIAQLIGFTDENLDEAHAILKRAQPAIGSGRLTELLCAYSFLLHRLAIDIEAMEMEQSNG